MKHSWETVKIGSIATQQKRIAKVDAKSNYNLIGIRSNNEGVFFRETKSGNDIFSNNLLQVNEGDFIYSRLSAPSGGFGVVTEEFDNCFVSNEFPVFEIDTNLSSSKFLFYYFSQKSVLYQLQSKGTGRTRFSEAEFFNQEILLPPLKVQNKILSTLEKVKSRLEEINSLRAEQAKDINNLLFSKYTDLIESAEWLPMKEVAPIHRRQVEVNPEETYFEIGVRSFGRGLFENPSFKGSDLTWQKPFWMREGDLLFSNIKAWEGAVGLIPAKYDGWVGSHRYITCLPNLEIIDPEFLYYYFRTFEGVEKLSSASPGTVDRNRTLNNKLLQQIEIPVPSLGLQREFVELLEKTNAIKEHHKQTDQELTELMPSLLDKAFKGEL
jgi:type I restriction enzyme S subunit